MLKTLSPSCKSRTLSIGETVVLGRNPETGITTLKCSRQQLIVELKEDLESVSVVQRGFHDSFINGSRIGKDKTVILSPQDKLEVLRNVFPFQFVPNSPNAASTGDDKSNSASPWVEGKNLHVLSPSSVQHSTDIAGFDMDGTLICTKSGRVFPKDESDWMLKFAEVGKKLRSLQSQGYKIVIFTNQKGILTGKQAVEPFRKKITAILAKLPAKNIQVFVSPGGTNYYRKPLPGMWEELESKFNGGLAVDRKKSFYVGDAAGRDAKGARKKDFSCNDRLFAENLGLKFYTPEEYFLSQRPEPFHMPDFLPETVFEPGRQLLEPKTAKMTSSDKEIIVMVGYPGSGKSHFVEANLKPKGYHLVNRDTLKTWQKCVEGARKALSAGKSVVVDNTNPDKESRKGLHTN